MSNKAKEWREVNKLTQEACAALLRVSLRCWQHWEGGSRSIPGPALAYFDLFNSISPAEKMKVTGLE